MKMKCPACGKDLAQLKAGDIELDACTHGCGGVWFDKDELDSFDEETEFSTSEILTLAKKCESVKVDPKRVKPCPRCQGEVLVRQFLDPKNEVQIDQCWKCGGVWLDVGEINTVRAQYATMADRSKAVNSYVNAQLKLAEDQMSADVKAQIGKYNEATSSRPKAIIYVLKRLLGLDDLQDGL